MSDHPTKLDWTLGWLGLVCILLVLIAASCAPPPGVSNGGGPVPQGGGEVSYTVFYVGDMPCLTVNIATSDLQTKTGVTCDWSKFER